MKSSTLVCHLKPWPNGLASRRKSTQILDLLSTCVSFGHPLASACVDFAGQAQICTEVDASFSPFGHPTQVEPSRKKPCRCFWLDLFPRDNNQNNYKHELERELTSPFGLPSQVRTQVLVLQLELTCVDLRVRFNFFT